MSDPTASVDPGREASKSRHASFAKLRHDLRTPINHIVGYCEMLMEEPARAEWTNYAQDLERMLEAGKRLLGLVNFYFDPVRVQSSPVDLSQANHDLRTPLNHVIGYAEILQEQAIEWECRSAASDLSKIAAAGHVLLDLLETHLLRPSPIEALTPASETASWPAIDVVAEPAVSLKLEGGTVLVVDDHPFNREMLERRLRRQGFTVLVASNGPEALGIIRSQPLDLVLLDMIMPEMDGFQVLKQIKIDRRFAAIPVIMLSAADEAATAVHCIKMGADDFLPKPCNTTLLLARIESSLAKKRLRELHRSESGYFFDKGTLQCDAPSYVERQADRDLLEAATQGEFSYVLTSRQMGKSSLMVRTAARLRDQGSSVVVLDLTAVGLNLTPDQWYDGLLSRIGRQLRLEDELEEFWTRRSRLGPVQRLFAALREVVLARHPRPLALFVDELDVVRSLPFSTDEFFAAIREVFNSRSEDPEFSRLTFCLLGVATPTDLVRDPRLTPFNIGRRIELADFSRSEAMLLAGGLRREPDQAQMLLDRVLHWTGGHPYLTQKACRAVAQDPEIRVAEQVDAVVEELFLTAKASDEDDNLQFVKRWMLSNEALRPQLWELFGQVLSATRVPRDDTPPELLGILRLAGIVRFEGDVMEVRNRIYARVFDQDWLCAHRA